MPDSPQSRCQFALSRGDITPPVGIYHRMWGAASHDRATGVHRPLTATALVLRPLEAGPDDDVALIALDHCLLWDREMRSLTDRVAAASGLDAARLLITFSHTHAAGLMGLERVELPGGDLIPGYLESLAETIARLVNDSRSRVAPVSICYATGRSNLAAQRDYWDDAHGEWVCGFNPDGTADDTVLVARVTDAEARPVATLVNYACHPTTLAWDNTLISPDYPGAMREVVETATGAPCVFLQGASGDLGPRDGFVGDTGVADRNGRQLGYAVLAALEALPPAGTRFAYQGPVVSGATIGTWAHVPLDETALEANAVWTFRRWEHALAYRPELSTVDVTLAEREAYQAREQQARTAGNLEQAANCRAMVERMTRRLTRIEVLPPGEFPFPIALWRLGGACLVAVEGELYQQFQIQLRARLPDVPILVCTLTGGSRCSYLPPAELYGSGIYQESIAVLAAGSLEALTELIASEMARCFDV